MPALIAVFRAQGIGGSNFGPTYSTSYRDPLEISPAPHPRPHPREDVVRHRVRSGPPPGLSRPTLKYPPLVGPQPRKGARGASARRLGPVRIVIVPVRIMRVSRGSASSPFGQDRPGFGPMRASSTWGVSIWADIGRHGKSSAALIPEREWANAAWSKPADILPGLDATRDPCLFGCEGHAGALAHDLVCPPPFVARSLCATTSMTRCRASRRRTDGAG